MRAAMGVVRRWRRAIFRRRRRWAFVILLALLLAIVLPRPAHRLAIRHKVAVAPVALEAPGPPGIVIHCSDTPARLGGHIVDEKRINGMHRDDHPNWKTVCDGKTYYIGYHYVILPNGTIQQGRPEDCIGTHARTYNDWLGICLIGDYFSHHHWWPDRPTRAQMHALIALCERLMSKYHIPPALVKRHSDINDTWCPGPRFPYHSLITTLKQYAATHPETRPIPGRIVSLTIPRRHARRLYGSEEGEGRTLQPPAARAQGHAGA